MKRTFAVVAVLCAIAFACDPLSRSELTLTFDETGERVNIEVASDEKHIARYHAGQADALAADVMAGRDEWSLRFASAKAPSERISIGRSGREIKDITHQALIPSVDLDKFFFDVGATVQFLTGDRWAELAIYPGESTRASREQRALVKERLNLFAVAAAHYFDTVRDLYAYLEANPERAEEVYFAMLSSKDDEGELSTRERELVLALRKAAEVLLQADDSSDDNRLFGRSADLVYNPLPAVVTVKVPGELLVVEGFRQSEGKLIASTATPLEALKALEGKWISPEPLSVETANDDVRGAARELAKRPRRATAVVLPSDIVDAMEKGMRPATRYRVRWTTKPAPAKPRQAKPGATPAR